MFREPILEEGVWNANRELVAAIGDESGGSKPGIEAVPVYLRLDPAEDLVPNARVRHDHACQPSGNVTFACRGGRDDWKEASRGHEEPEKPRKSDRTARRTSGKQALF